MTDQYQSLDRRVFGCLKSSARSWFMRTPRTGRTERIKKHEAVEVLIKYWTQLSESVVREAWSVSETDGNVEGADY
jgi:hypothetical protein